jgi:hypothetical protein
MEYYILQLITEWAIRRRDLVGGIRSLEGTPMKAIACPQTIPLSFCPLFGHYKVRNALPP